jgi:glycosyltransferase involved in cell wall biosynthesis
VQIDHITFSKTGGAGIVAQTIAKAQRSLGHDAKVWTVVDSDLRSEPLTRPDITLAAAFDQLVVSSQHEKTLFSPLRGRLESFDLKKIRANSTIHMHWMTGVINQQTLTRILDSGRKVVWTLHDMNPFTGGCHHAHDCDGYVYACSNCPQAKGIFSRAVSFSLQKKLLSRSYPNLQVVSPTSWLAGQAAKSAVFQGQQLSVIPNPINDEFFSTVDRRASRKKFSISEENFVCTVIAKDLADPNKNVAMVLKALELASNTSTRPITLLLIGRNGISFSSSNVDVRMFGEIPVDQIPEIVSSADVVLSGSAAESAGMTIVECAALGIPAIALQNGGTSDLIEDCTSGFLVQDFDSFLSRISELVQDESLTSKLGIAARQGSLNHKATLVAKSYLDLYESLQ